MSEQNSRSGSTNSLADRLRRLFRAVESGNGVDEAVEEVRAVGSRRETPRSGSTPQSGSTPIVIPPVVRRGKSITQVTAGETAGRVTFVSPPDYLNAVWETHYIDIDDIVTESPNDVMMAFIDANAEFSRALWDAMRFFNPGHEIYVLELDGERRSAKGDEVIALVMHNLSMKYGSPDIVFNRLFLNAWLRGAFFIEGVFDSTGLIDIVAPDPWSARFKVQNNTYVLGQLDEATNNWVDLSKMINVMYLPIDPPPRSPYGRPLATPAIYGTVFLMTVLRDMLRVISQQGYPRIDIEIVQEKVQAAMGEDATEQEYRDAIDVIIEQVAAAYEALLPDDAYVHTDTVKVNRPIGTLDLNALATLNIVISFLERNATRALKTQPLMMAMESTSGETYANREWEIFVAGVKSLQHLAESALERLFLLALNEVGVQGKPVVRFAELRASEMYRDETVLAMKINNALAMYINGWISHEEASIYATGHKPAMPAPLNIATIVGGGAPPTSGSFSTARPQSSNPNGTPVSVDTAPIGGQVDEEAPQESGRMSHAERWRLIGLLAKG